MQPQKYWLLVQANPREDSGSAWMFAVGAADEADAEKKVMAWAKENHHHFAVITTLGNVAEDPDYAHQMGKVDKRKTVISFGRRSWSAVKI